MLRTLSVLHPLVNVDQGRYIRHKVHRDVQSKEVEYGGTVLRTDVTNRSDMSCRRTYIPSTWSAVCVFSPSRMAERMASLDEDDGTILGEDGYFILSIRGTVKVK